MADSGGRLRLTAGDALLLVSPADGGRIESLLVGGREVIARVDRGPIWWGSFPMAPFAGRVRDGRFTFRDRTWQLPLGMPPHAIHGIVHDRAWRVVDRETIEVPLGDPWPFAGTVRQRFALEPGRMRVTMELAADEPMPASIGWHPWFPRRYDRGDPDVDLTFEARAMFERGADGLPTGRLVAPKPRPWDDCFTGLRANPTLRWPDGFELEIASTCANWVVFDERDDALCVEPQTAPPDALNLDPTIVEPGSPLVATMEWRWRPA
jgi:aldose 1-epimerase